eukprot:5251112-Prymnesium_polylepis.1
MPPQVACVKRPVRRHPQSPSEVDRDITGRPIIVGDRQHILGAGRGGGRRAQSPRKDPPDAPGDCRREETRWLAARVLRDCQHLGVAKNCDRLVLPGSRQRQ